MPFCSCGDLECICEGRCGCDRRYCLCTSCHDLRRKDWCKVCGLPSSYGELSASTTAADICKCSSVTYPPILLLRFRRLDSSSDASTENVPVSELPNAENEMLKEFDTTQYLPEEKVETGESSRLPVEDISRIHCTSRLTDESSNIFPSPEFISIKESSSASSRQYSSVLERGLLKPISFTDQTEFHTDNEESSSKERDRPAESCSLSPRSCGSRLSKGSSSISESSLASDFSMLEIPDDNRWNSEFSIIEMPEYELSPSSRISSYLIGDPTAAISIFRTSSVPYEQRDDLHPRFSSLPPIHTYIGSLINRSLLTVPRTITISPSGQLSLLPSPNSQLSPFRNTSLDKEKSSSSNSLSAVSHVQETSALSRDALTSTGSIHSSAVSQTPKKDEMSPSKLETIHTSDLQNVPQSVVTTRELSQEDTVSEFPIIPRAESPEQLHEVSPEQDI